MRSPSRAAVCSGFLFVTLFSCLGSGCSPAEPEADAGLDAPATDAPTTTDVPPMFDTPAPMDTPAPIDARPVRDVRPDGYREDTPARCGYAIESGTFECGATDPWPNPPCSSPFSRCCVGVCDPFGTDQVCCDPSTGRIEIYRYSAGACPLYDTIDC